jgi:putative transposase
MHFVWITKYRKKILRGGVALRFRELTRQICLAEDVEIVRGHVGKDHVHLFVSMPTDMSASKFMQKIKGTTARKLLMEFGELKKVYWGTHIWGRGYFVASAGNVTDELIMEYIEKQGGEPAVSEFSVEDEVVEGLATLVEGRDQPTAFRR